MNHRPLNQAKAHNRNGTFMLLHVLQSSKCIMIYEVIHGNECQTPQNDIVHLNHFSFVINTKSHDVYCSSSDSSGVYAGDVGVYCGVDGLYCGLVGEYFGLVGLYVGLVGL